MSQYQPPSVTIFPWLRANLGSHCLAPLTGTDRRALRAAVQIIELYSYAPAPSVLEAFGQIVSTQTPNRQIQLALKLIW